MYTGGYDVASESDDDDALPSAPRAAPRAAAPAAAPAPSRADEFFNSRSLSELEKLMEEKYANGRSLARGLLLSLRCHDAYKRWRRSIDLEHESTLDKEAAAFESILAACEVTAQFDDACDSVNVSRTWIFHGLIYIIPLFIEKHGSLWPFSSAKLEARGGKLKPIWRKQVCKRRPGVTHKTISKSRKGLSKGATTGVKVVKQIYEPGLQLPAPLKNTRNGR